MYFIYGLIDPRSERIYYVGCSTDPQARFKSHARANAPDCSADVVNAELKALGLKPGMKILDRADTREAASDRERFWITNLEGLVNRDPGGLPLTGQVLTIEQMKAELQSLEGRA